MWDLQHINTRAEAASKFIVTDRNARGSLLLHVGSQAKRVEQIREVVEELLHSVHGLRIK